MNLKDIIIAFFQDIFCLLFGVDTKVIILYFLHFFSFSLTNLLFGEKVGE